MEPNTDAAIFILDETRTLNQIVKELQAVPEIARILVVTPNPVIARNLSGVPKVTVILEEKREGKSAAVQKAVNTSTAPYFLHVSGDTKISSGGVQMLIDRIKQGDCGAVTSHVNVSAGRGVTRGVSRFIWGVYNETNHTLNGIGLAKTGDVYIVRRELIPELDKTLINDDAFIDSKVTSKNSTVLEVEAVVQINVPSRVCDHVFQRGRIIQGHLQLFKEHKVLANNIEFTNAIGTKAKVKIVTRAMMRSKNIRYAPITVLLEVMCWGYAGIGLLSGRQHVLWRRVTRAD